MAVFDATRNQVLISPVTNYYQGEAIRRQAREAEQRMDLRDLQIEQAEYELETAPDRADIERRKVELREDEAERLRGQLNQRMDEFEYMVGKDAAKEYAKQGYGITYAIDAAVQSGEVDQDAALEMAAESLSEYASGLPRELGEPLLQKLQDGLTVDEYREAKAGFILGMDRYDLLETFEPDDRPKYKAKQNYVGDDGKEYIGWFDDTGDYHKTGMLAKNPDGEDVNFEPMNSGEREAAMSFVKSDEVLDDLSAREKVIAAEIIGNDIRQLQANEGKSYAEAAAMAVAGVKERIKLEPDLLTGTDSKLDLGAHALGEGEYRGKDGHIYIETEDGGFRRKD